MQNGAVYFGAPQNLNSNPPRPRKSVFLFFVARAGLGAKRGRVEPNRTAAERHGSGSSLFAKGAGPQTCQGRSVSLTNGILICAPRATGRPRNRRVHCEPSPCRPNALNHAHHYDHINVCAIVQFVAVVGRGRFIIVGNHANSAGCFNSLPTPIVVRHSSHSLSCSTFAIC